MSTAHIAMPPNALALVNTPITIWKSREWTQIKLIATVASVYEAASDDYAPRREDWQPDHSHEIHYMLAAQGRQVLGFCAFWPQNRSCWEAHLCFLPRAHGSKAEIAFRQMVAYVWMNTPAHRIVGSIPEYNRAALAFADRVGCKVFGRNPKSWLKHGILHDQILVGLSKP